MNDVLTMPEASPDSSGLTSLIAASSSGFIAIPIPIPRMTMAREDVDREAGVDRSAREEREPERRRDPSRRTSGSRVP